MAVDRRFREGFFAGVMLNGLRCAEKLREKRLRRLARADQAMQQLIRQIIEKEARDLPRRLVPGVVSSGPAWNPLAITPIRCETRTDEKTIAHEAAAARPAVDRVPDVVQVITAYRAWRAAPVNGQARLVALGVNVVWEPRQKAEAECRLPAFSIKRKLLGLSSDEAARCEHEAPDFYCRCGVWGFKSIENLFSALDPRYKPSVIGKVSLWGRVIETENGYRAQYAYPQELWTSSVDSSAQELALAYGVPVRTC